MSTDKKGDEKATLMTMVTANDRFKANNNNWFWGSFIAAAVIHFCVFNFWPTLVAEDIASVASELISMELPPEITIPPPPQAIARPATPVVSSSADIDEDITIAPTTFEDNPVTDLPPPPEEEAKDITAEPTFTPFTVAPSILNRDEVIRAMEREYPPLLRDAGIGGTVQIFFFIDEEGQVQDSRVETSSGHQNLDEAALKVAYIYRFSPALNRDKRVPVWVKFPVTFQVR